MTSALGVKARVDPLACRLHRLRTTDPSDSPLVRYLLLTTDQESRTTSNTAVCCCEYVKSTTIKEAFNISWNTKHYDEGHHVMLSRDFISDDTKPRTFSNVLLKLFTVQLFANSRARTVDDPRNSEF